MPLAGRPTPPPHARAGHEAPRGGAESIAIWRRDGVGSTGGVKQRATDGDVRVARHRQSAILNADVSERPVRAPKCASSYLGRSSRAASSPAPPHSRAPLYIHSNVRPQLPYPIAHATGQHEFAALDAEGIRRP